MAIDPKDVKEGCCMECGQPEDGHITLYRGAVKPHRIMFCMGAKLFTPKPPAPKAKPGVLYRHNRDASAYAVGSHDGQLYAFGYSGGKWKSDFTLSDWQEV